MSSLRVALDLKLPTSDCRGLTVEETKALAYLRAGRLAFLDGCIDSHAAWAHCSIEELDIDIGQFNLIHAIGIRTVGQLERLLSLTTSLRKGGVFKEIQRLKNNFYRARRNGRSKPRQ